MDRTSFPPTPRFRGVPAPTLLLVILALAAVRPASAIKPHAEYARRPADLGLEAEPVTIATPDGWDLAGWYMTTSEPAAKGTLVLAYGDAGNMGFMLDYAAAFGARGFDVLTFDYRGFGDSDPFAGDLRRLIHAEYLTDLEAAVAFAASRSTGPILVYGQSMGAVLAIAVAAGRGDVAGVVAEGPYTTTADLLEALVADPSADDHRPQPPVDYPADAEPLTAAARFDGTALCVLAGSGDVVVAPAMAYRLYHVCPSRLKSIWIAPGTVHGSIAADHTGTFVELVGAFLEQAAAAYGP
jgi:pimeloyl-ACP methyl ester carboxylesterase